MQLLQLAMSMSPRGSSATGAPCWCGATRASSTSSFTTFALCTSPAWVGMVAFRFPPCAHPASWNPANHERTESRSATGASAGVQRCWQLCRQPVEAQHCMLCLKLSALRPEGVAHVFTFSTTPSLPDTGRRSDSRLEYAAALELMLCSQAACGIGGDSPGRGGAHLKLQREVCGEPGMRFYLVQADAQPWIYDKDATNEVLALRTQGDALWDDVVCRHDFLQQEED